MGQVIRETTCHQMLFTEDIRGSVQLLGDGHRSFNVITCDYNDFQESQQGNRSFSTLVPSTIYSTSMVYVSVSVCLM